MRTPLTGPQRSMRTPPAKGPSAMGSRRMSECIDTPMTCLFVGNVDEIRLMVAGREMALQERKSSEANSTACQCGMTRTIR